MLHSFKRKKYLVKTINIYLPSWKNLKINTEKDGILVDGMLGISRPTVYELLKKNEFRWIQIGNKYRISKKSFDEWLDQKSETI